MSIEHPIVAVTGSSGAGTTSVKTAFEQVFSREGIKPAIIEEWPELPLRRSRVIAGNLEDRNQLGDFTLDVGYRPIVHGVSQNRR